MLNIQHHSILLVLQLYPFLGNLMLKISFSRAPVYFALLLATLKVDIKHMTCNFNESWISNMRALLLVAMSIALLSCAALEKKQQASFYNKYKSYIDALKTGNYDSALTMLTLQNQFSISKDNESFTDFFPFFSSVDTVITDEKNYNQVFFGSKGCLTVNGFNSANEPTSLNFELLTENNEWKFSYVQMMYHESTDEFPLSVKCPPNP